jgi:hypothetical protein
MTRMYVLAMLPALVVLSLRADTIELKTGERIDGAFKQANSSGVVIEVAGQSITIPLEKVQAIYFGAVPARPVAGPAPSQEALDALRALRSVTGSGIAYRDYSQRVLDAKVKVDRYLTSSGSQRPELVRAIRVAMLEYELASQAWLTKPDPTANGSLWKPMGVTMQDPDVAKCPTVKAATELNDNPPAPAPSRKRPPRSIDRSQDLGLTLAIAEQSRYWLLGSVTSGIWTCAATQVSQAQQLLTMTLSPSSPPAPAQATANFEQVVANSDPAEASRVAAVRLANLSQGLSPIQAQMIQKGQASICSVVTAPPGAEIEVDGKRAGVSPLAFVLTKQGDTPRQVTIRMSGYKPVVEAVIPDGKAIPIGLALEKQ